MTTRRDIIIEKYTEFTKKSVDYLDEKDCLFPSIESLDISLILINILTIFNDPDEDLDKLKMLLNLKGIVIRDKIKRQLFFELVLEMINFIRNLR